MSISSNSSNLRNSSRNKRRNFHFTYYCDFSLLRDSGQQEVFTNFCEKVNSVSKVDRAVAQIEVCPETNRRHLQGFIIFKNELGGNAGRRAIQHGFVGAHCEHARKGIEAGFSYCTKSLSRLSGPYYYPAEWSPRGKQGHRSDLDAAIETLRSSGWDQLVDRHGSDVVRYSRGFGVIRESLERRSRQQYRDVKVLVLWGNTRTGKTRLAYSLASVHSREGDGMFRLPLYGKMNDLWFDGYQGEEILLLDDFYGNIPITLLMNILDGHPLRCAVKGSFVYAQWKYVIITSNVSHEDWYTPVAEGGKIPDEVFNAFRARITRDIRLFGTMDYHLYSAKTLPELFE